MLTEKENDIFVWITLPCGVSTPEKKPGCAQIIALSILSAPNGREMRTQFVMAVTESGSLKVSARCFCIYLEMPHYLGYSSLPLS